MKMLPYNPALKTKCLALFDGNVPAYFSVEERSKFESFLDEQIPPSSYFLVEDDDSEIGACGGITTDIRNKSAMLRWDMVEKIKQGKGIGTLLIKFRIALICRNVEYNKIILGASQFTHGFYEKLGFQTKRILKDGIAHGFDEYFMELEITEKVRAEYSVGPQYNVIP